MSRDWEQYSQFVAVSVLLHGRTTWTITKCQEKKLDENYWGVLHAILNKSWKLDPKKQQMYGHLPPISQTVQIRQVDMLGTVRELRMDLYAMFSHGLLNMETPVLVDQQKLAFTSSEGPWVQGTC